MRKEDKNRAVGKGMKGREKGRKEGRGRQEGRKEGNNKVRLPCTSRFVRVTLAQGAMLIFSKLFNFYG